MGVKVKFQVLKKIYFNIFFFIILTKQNIISTFSKKFIITKVMKYYEIYKCYIQYNLLHRYVQYI
jgi:hypothetical protein